METEHKSLLRRSDKKALMKGSGRGQSLEGVSYICHGAWQKPLQQALGFSIQVHHVQQS